MSKELTVSELIVKRNAMGQRIITYINEQLKQFNDDTGIAVVDIQISTVDASEHDKVGHFVDRVYILLDI